MLTPLHAGRGPPYPLGHDQHEHLTGNWPAAQLRYGLIEDGEELVGTCVLGVPVQKAVLTGPFPAFEPYRQSMELVRLVLLDRVPANAESARCCIACNNSS